MLGQLLHFLRRRTAQRAFAAQRPGFEPLEERTLLSAGLLNIPIEYPAMTFNSGAAMSLTYDAAAQTLHAQATPFTFRETGVSVPRSVVMPARSVTLDIKVDNAGNLIGGVAGDDLVITGNIDVNGDSVIEYSGVLLTGEILQFGWLDGGATDSFDFRFAATGGALVTAGYYAGKDVGMAANSLNSTLDTVNGQGWAGNFGGTFEGKIGPAPRFGIAKSSDVASISPGGKVTFTYMVTNLGVQPLHDVTLLDDNGTPDFADDDFVPSYVSGDVNSNNLLDPAEVWAYTATVIPVLDQCDVVDGVAMDVGQLITQILPSGDVQVTYVQSMDLNDNTYGANVVDWGSQSHTFSSLLGSDKAEFVFKNANGQVVMDFLLDYVSATTTTSSGYKSLGISGGDGRLTTGSASWLVSYDTSLSQDFNSLGFGVVNGVASNGFNLTLNSPKTVSNASYDVVDPFFTKWEFRNIYTVVVSKSAFGTSGFGSVTVPSVHNSPPKAGQNESTPEPCEGVVTNNVTVTAKTPTGVVLTASDDASVLIKVGGGSSEGGTVVASAPQVKKNKLVVQLTNTGTTAVTLESLQLTWPSANKALKKVRMGGVTIFDVKTPPGQISISAWKGAASARTLAVGESLRLEIEFEHGAVKTLSSYDLTADFGAGLVLTIL